MGLMLSLLQGIESDDIKLESGLGGSRYHPHIARAHNGARDSRGPDPESGALPY